MSAVLYVAEIGSNHEGNPHLACEMIRQAANAGASIAKFQFGWTQEAQEGQGKTYLKLRHIDRDFAHQIADYCKDVNIELMASIWSEEGLETSRAVDVRRYKIAYQKRNDGELLSKVLGQRRQTFVSGGTWSEMTVPIWCVSKYPTYAEDLVMPAKFGVWYGYSDHHHGIGACLLAVARGAMYVEKHFTLNKASQTIRDNAFSATPEEFAELVRVGHELERVRDAQIVV